MNIIFKQKFLIFKILLSGLVGTLVVSSIVFAATTISTNVSTGGTISVTGQLYASSTVMIANTYGIDTDAAGALNIGTTTATTIIIGSATAKTGIASSTPWAFFGINANGIPANVPSFAVASSAVTNFVVSNAGNIGVGTSTPGSLFALGNAAGSGGLFITSSGNVGISTTTPMAVIAVGGAATNQIAANAGAAATPAYAFVSDLGSGVWNPSQGALAFSTNGVERARVLSTGNVGIASTTPWALFGINANALTANVPSFAVASSAATNLIVSNSGNVGVGTSTPGSLFSVGNAATNGGFYVLTTSGNVGVGTSSPMTAVALGGTTGQVAATPGTAAAPGYVFNSDTASGVWSPSNGALALSSNGVERARITSTGNVGIASTTPSALFGVNANGISSTVAQFAVGSSTATNFIVTNGGNIGIATNTPVSGPILTIGNNQNTTAASTTIIMGKLQFQGQTSNGSTVCIFFTTAGGVNTNASTTILNSACNN